MATKKNNKNIIKIIMTLIIVIIAIAGYEIIPKNTGISELNRNNEKKTVSEEKSPITAQPINGENLVVRYLDVGQGDSILIQNAEQTMLIDAGTNKMGATVVKYLQDYGVEKIDYLVGTHPHEDHIGGLDDVINNFEIGTIYMPKIQNNTKTFEDVLDAISNKNLTITAPEFGYIFHLGNTKCEIMCAGTGSKEEQSNLNLSSIVIRLVYGENSFLFMGDAEQENEESRTWSKTTILKVGHHGSDTSSSYSFLKQINPEVAIISVGNGNSYGHPRQNIINRLEELGTKIYRTDENKTITITCDGNNYEINNEK